MCYIPLEGHFAAAVYGRYSQRAPTKIRQNRRHGFPLRKFAARDGSEVPGIFALSEGWENRANARVFCAEIARIREELAERHAAFNAYLNGELDSESESDDSDSEPQYDDDDPRAY